MYIDKDAMTVINMLKDNGYEAYVVGGCVRDSILGRTPHDWDICTIATTDEIQKVFHNYPIIPTGIQHGTVTIFIKDTPFEVTTYRTDGDYLDGRHPENVQFVKDIKSDLERRDFTINAIASNGYEFVDFFNGKEDIDNKIIRCVGDPYQRFSEDKLRVMRAMRFASQLGFDIEPNTLMAMKKYSSSIRGIISNERIRDELIKLLDGKFVENLLLNETILSVFFDIFPEFHPMFHFEQHNKHHCFDVWEHTVKTVSLAKHRWTKVAALLHDMAKPETFTMDEKGEGHFSGHPKISANHAKNFLKGLNFSNDDVERITQLVEGHDFRCPVTKKSALHALNKYGKEMLLSIIDFSVTDIMSQSDYNRDEKLSWATEMVVLIKAIEEDASTAFTIKSLAINGNDLIALGYKPGPEMGKILNNLLEATMNESVKNNYDDLIEYLKSIKVEELH